MKQNPQFCMTSTYTYSDWGGGLKFPKVQKKLHFFTLSEAQESSS